MDKQIVRNLNTIKQVAAERLLSRRNSEGLWEGCLSSSPLATAVTVFALYKVNSVGYRHYIEKGLNWLARMQNPDGGWGDTDGADPSNLSTTLICRSAFYGCDAICRFEIVLNKADRWIGSQTGSIAPESIVKSVYAIYGTDRTFAVPILTMCALAGCLGADGWKHVAALPFELAVLPRRLFRWLNLSVVSYALPALIAIGQVKLHYDPPRNPFTRWIRNWIRRKTLDFLVMLQPSNGGFLEAVPLTAFVTMSLASMNLIEHPVVKKAVEFLTQSIRSDGSWPIDTNLATWLTTLSVNAFGGKIDTYLRQSERAVIRDWLLKQQFQTVHIFTGSDAGGWGWTDKPGVVPDADDSAGALIALYHLDKADPDVQKAAEKGLLWLINLQNSDGGVPTFCKGWGKLPFDRSCPDITAHTITAWLCWKKIIDCKIQGRVEKAIVKALRYLQLSQQNDGSWIPLWFGNPKAKLQTNPIYGTSKVLCCLLSMKNEYKDVRTMIHKAIQWLVSNQNRDGSWGAETIGTVEETSLAVTALISVVYSDYFKAPKVDIDSTAADNNFVELRVQIQKSLEMGFNWLIVPENNIVQPAPIGLYFAKLWYYEHLYPELFKAAAFQLIN